MCPQDLGYLMEAHNGLSAKICAEVGFKGIWGSVYHNNLRTS